MMKYLIEKRAEIEKTKLDLLDIEDEVTKLKGKNNSWLEKKLKLDAQQKALAIKFLELDIEKIESEIKTSAIVQKW